MVVVVVNLLQVDEHDRVMKRKARFGTLTALPDSASSTVCTTSFMLVFLNFTVIVSYRFIVIVIRILLACIL